MPMSLVAVLGAALMVACPVQQEVLAAAGDVIARDYVDEARGADIAQAVAQWAESGRYAGDCDDPAAFLSRLNIDLDAYDGHFHVEASSDGADNGQDWLMAWRADATRVNAGVREVRVLEGNIGYLRLSTFYPWEVAGQKLRNAFELLADSEGLVLDLRQNGGGDESTANQLVRALLGAGVDSVQQIERRGVRTGSPLPKGELPPFTRPVVVLVDRRTGSAAEFVAYSLQAAGRAKLVGSRTGGAANFIGKPVPLPHGYRIFVPDAKPVNTTTGANWDRQGVEPDIRGGDDPLFVARMALAGGG
jgi:carboxyl-terminal processing protease